MTCCVARRRPCARFGYRQRTPGAGGDGRRHRPDCLRRDGLAVNHKRIQRLMHELELRAIQLKPNLSKRRQGDAVSPYLLRGVKAERADQIWGTDITYIRLRGGSFVYLVAVIDWYSHYVVSWELEQSLEQGFVQRALKQALAGARPEILNSDQGSHFTSSQYQSLLRAAG